MVRNGQVISHIGKMVTHAAIPKKPLASLAIFLACLLTAAQAWAVAFGGLYAFGDSLSDAGASSSALLSIYKLLGGNCDPLHPCPPYFEGRYSNGPVAVEYLADAVLSGGANSTNFFDFAVAGSTTGIGNFGDGGSTTTAGIYGLPGMSQQIAFYLSSSGGVADPNALYFLWGGANDFLTGDSPILAAQDIAAYAGALAGAGVTHLLAPNLPDLSLTPFAENAGLQTQAHAFSLAFNSTLAIELQSLSALLPNTDIIQFDTYAFVNDVAANPEKYGFTNATDACLSSSLTPCPNPDEHVFWDVFHPTTSADAIIASAFAKSVPEPTTLALLGVGIAGIGYQRRKRWLGRAKRAESAAKELP